MDDSGRANERTALAWTRSVLAVLAVCLIVARVAAADFPIVAITLAVAALLTTIISLRFVRRRYQRITAVPAGRGPPADGRAPTAILVLVVMLGVGGIVLILGG